VLYLFQRKANLKFLNMEIEIMPPGALRTVSFPPDEMILLGKEMVTWVKKNIKTVYHLSEWYTVEKMFTYNQWKSFIQCKEFLPYYEQALKIIAKKYLNGDVPPPIAQRWQRIYFGDIRESEDVDAEADAERKAKALKGDARATEEERQKVMEEVQRNRKPIK